MKRLTVATLTVALVMAFSSAVLAEGKPRAAALENASVLGGPYINDVTAAVPDAFGVVVTPAGGGKSPLCKIVVHRLLPDTEYIVFRKAGDWVKDPVPFVTDKNGKGMYECPEAYPIGDGNPVYINMLSPNYTVLVSGPVNDD